RIIERWPARVITRVGSTGWRWESPSARRLRATMWYFAYGSNMQSETLRGRRGVPFRRAVVVRAPGWRVVFDKPPLFSIGEAFANIVREPDAVAWGVAFEIGDDDLAQIERSEGVMLGNYRRVQLAVEALIDCEDAPRVVTSLASDRRDPSLLPSTRY